MVGVDVGGTRVSSVRGEAFVWLLKFWPGTFD